MANLGRPRKVLDEEKICNFIAKGFTVKFVAAFFDVSEMTLYANYSEALRKGYAFREGCLQNKQFESALNGNPTMQIWLGKQWLHQRDQVAEKPPETIQLQTEHKIVVEVVNRMDRPVRVKAKENGVSTTN